MPATILSGPALARKIKPDLLNTWKKRYEAAKARLAKFCELGAVTEDFVSLYGYGESPVYPAYTPWGEGPDADPHRYRTYTGEMRRWTSEVYWKTRDKRYSSMGTIESDARKAGGHYGTLFERCVFQQLTAATNAQLMPVIPNCPDGVGLFSTTDGDSNDRFGVSGGNVESSVTFSTGAGLRNGIFAAIERMLQFQDPRGEPALDDAILDNELIVLLPVTRLQEAQAAFKQQIVAIDTSSATSNAAESNLILDSGYKLLVWPTVRITSDVGMVISTGVHGSGDLPLISEVVGMPLVDTPYDRNNSRELGRKGLEGVFYEYEMVPVPHLPLGAVQLT